MGRSIAIVGNFLVDHTVLPIFVDHGLKLRVLILAIGYWPEIAKKQGEPRKRTRDRKRNLFGGWSQWESCSPGYADDMPC